MMDVLLFVAGVWACAWGLYSTMVARRFLRRAVAAVTGPVGVLLVTKALISLLVPGFFN